MIPFDNVINAQKSQIKFGDMRLDNLVKTIIEKIDERGSHNSFPNIFHDSSELKAFYRMINNKKVIPEKLLQGYNQGLAQHFQQTLLSGTDEFVFNYQDSTFAKYHNRKKLKLGYLETLKDNGLVLHTGILTCSKYIPLGVSHQQVIIRPYDQFGKSKERSTKDFTEKESYKWTAGFEWGQRFSQQIQIPIVQVCDREADIAQLYNYAFSLNQYFLIRLSHNRKVLNSKPSEEEEDMKLWEYMMNQSITQQVSRTLIDRVGKKHEVDCAIRIALVEFEDINAPIWAVYLQALNPPDEMEETNWILLTNLPLTRHQQMPLLVVDAYTKRWRTTEDFHKCLKTGCQIEERQFDSPEAMKNVITLLSLSAMRLLRMRHLSEVAPNDSVCQILDEAEIKLATLLGQQFLKPVDLKCCQEQSILWWVLLLGRMGGHQGIRQKGLPGWQTMFKGWIYFQNILKGINLSKNFFNHNFP